MIIDGYLEIIAILYIIFAVITMTSVIVKVAHSHKISIMNMCSVMYILLLCIVPAVILLGYTNGLKVTNGIVFEKTTTWTFYVQLLMTIVGYFFLHFGYKIKQKEKRPFDDFAGQKNFLVSIIFSIISAGSLYLWASGYGGIAELIIKANQIRAGFVSSTNSFTFFKHFVPLSLLASWMLFNLLIRKENKRMSGRICALLLLLCNVWLSFIYIQANDGRMLLAVYIFLFFVIYLKYQYEIKKSDIAPMLIRFGIVFIVVISILFNADTILLRMKGENYETGGTDIVSTISKEFSFIVSGTQTALISNVSENGNLMIVNDVVNGVFAWLPTSMKPIILEDVWDYNTRLINSGGYGQSPTSIVAQSVYDLHIFGIIILPLIYGIFIKKIEKKLERHKGNVFYDTIYVALGYYLCKGIPYFSLYNIMMNTFFIFVATLIYNTVHRLRIR